MSERSERIREISVRAKRWPSAARPALRELASESSHTGPREALAEWSEAER
jgi:hypothetical protein